MGDRASRTRVTSEAGFKSGLLCFETGEVTKRTQVTACCRQSKRILDVRTLVILRIYLLYCPAIFVNGLG